MAQLFSLGIITLMHIIPFLRGADFVSTILVDTMVICFAFPAYRRTQMRAFGFLILGSVVGIILECGLQLHRSSPYTSTDDAVTFSWPNQSPEPTAVGASVASYVLVRRWLSFFR